MYDQSGNRPDTISLHYDEAHQGNGAGSASNGAATVLATQHHPNPMDEPQALTPMELMQLALTKGTDIGQLEKLMLLQEKWEAREAKKSYHSAMNAFKADPPEILKNHKVAFGQTSYDHATLDHVCRQVTQGLSKHDISHRWKVEQKEGVIRVTCVLTHSMGHSEETTLESIPDNSGSKNSIQAIGSTVTYLERYSLLAATGLAASGQDNDGQGAQKFDKLQEYLDSMMTAPNLNVLETTFKAAFKEAAAQMNTKAMKTLVSAKDARKAQILKDEPAQ